MSHQSVVNDPIKEDLKSVIDFDCWFDVRSRVRYMPDGIGRQAREIGDRIMMEDAPIV